MKYAGFWKRLGAICLDGLIMSPMVILSFWGEGQSRLFQIYFFIPTLVFGLWYGIYLVKRYGGTPGKLLLNIKVCKLDGDPIAYKEAIIRYSVFFILTFFISIPPMLVVLGMTDTEYLSMDFEARSVAITERSSWWYILGLAATYIWLLGEVIAMLANKKRRAIHDFMAGTVVVHKAIPASSEKMDG